MMIFTNSLKTKKKIITYILEHQKERWKKFNPSDRHYFDFEEQEKLKEGALVYFEPYTEGGIKKAKNISRVKVARIGYPLKAGHPLRSSDSSILIFRSSL